VPDKASTSLDTFPNITEGRRKETFYFLMTQGERVMRGLQMGDHIA
jgi:hypothetical protein